MNITPPTFPARPVNGGPLDLALPKSGQWYYEPKYNGWRALVHTPTGTMFNRLGQRLSIEDEFNVPLALLKRSPFVWVDCEALERRHNLCRGSLIILDAIEYEARARDLPTMPYRERHELLRNYFLGEPMGAAFLEPGTIGNQRLYLSPHLEDHVPPEQPPFAVQLWNELKEANSTLGCPFYEGVVAKRADSRYPVQLRSAAQEFPFWMKHRWAF